MYHDSRRCRRSDFHARDSAAGWGVESAVTDATRSGWLAASSHATAPPQSWPTTCARSTPAASSSASTSASSSSRRYAARPGGRAPGGVAALVGCERAQPGRVEQRRHAVPRRAVGREAVQQHHRLAAERSGVVDLEGEAVTGEGGQACCVGSHPPIMSRTAARRSQGSLREKPEVGGTCGDLPWRHARHHCPPAHRSPVVARVGHRASSSRRPTCSSRSRRACCPAPGTTRA